MNKFEDHGLTRAEDDIIGAFDPSVPEGRVIPLTHFAHFSHGDAAKSLIRKGLLIADVTPDLGVELKLTPKGVKLWNIRSEEEEEGPSLSHSVPRRKAY